MFEWLRRTAQEPKGPVVATITAAEAAKAEEHESARRAVERILDHAHMKLTHIDSEVASWWHGLHEKYGLEPKVNYSYIPATHEIRKVDKEETK